MFSPTIESLLNATAGGNDCIFALHDAFLEEGLPEFAEICDDWRKHYDKTKQYHWSKWMHQPGYWLTRLNRRYRYTIRKKMKKMVEEQNLLTVNSV